MSSSGKDRNVGKEGKPIQQTPQRGRERHPVAQEGEHLLELKTPHVKIAAAKVPQGGVISLYKRVLPGVGRRKESQTATKELDLMSKNALRQKEQSPPPGLGTFLSNVMVRPALGNSMLTKTDIQGIAIKPAASEGISCIQCKGERIEGFSS